VWWRGWPPSRIKNIRPIFCPQNGCILCVLTGRKHGQPLEALGHGFYGSITKQSLQKQAKIIQKFTMKPVTTGAVALSPPLHTPLGYVIVYYRRVSSVFGRVTRGCVCPSVGLPKLPHLLRVKTKMCKFRGGRVLPAVSRTADFLVSLCTKIGKNSIVATLHVPCLSKIST